MRMAGSKGNKLSQWRFVVALSVLFISKSNVYAMGKSSSLSGAAMVTQRLQSQKSSLSPDDTMALLQEAEAWRLGRYNRSIDEARAISLYWSVASGQGPAIGAALNQLAWLHLVPSRMSRPIQEATRGVTQEEAEDASSTSVSVGWSEWTTFVARKYFGVHLSQLWLVSMGRKLGWFAGSSDGSEFSEFSDRKTQEIGPKSDRDIEAAVALWLEGAKVGNAEAQHALATHLASPAFLGEDEHTPQVDSLVKNYFAALGGTTLAQMTLGYRHLMGYGVPKSCENAAVFYELAANRAVLDMKETSGDYPGLIVLPPGEALSVKLSEEGEKKSKESDQEVLLFFEAAALAGDLNAITNLGHIYLSGSRGVAQDIDKAVRMYRRAFKMGNAAASGVLGALTYGGVGVAQSCQRAAEIWRVGEATGDPASFTGLGVYYSRSCGSNQANLTLASEYWEKAAQKGHMDGLYLLGMHYLKMTEVAQLRAVEARQSLDSLKEVGGLGGSEGAGEGRAVATFHKDLPGREAAREVAAAARETTRRLKSEQSLLQRQKEATLTKTHLDPEKERAIALSEAEFADREEKRWAQAAEREEARLLLEAENLDSNADKYKDVAARKKFLEDEVKMMTKSVANQIHKATSCLSTAAQHGHVLALHQMGLLYVEGRGVAMNCASAVQSLKSVAERGQPVASTVASALALFKANDAQGARLLYAYLAEAGLELGQLNAAWLLERGLKPGNWEGELNVCGNMDKVTCEKAALKLWKQAAKQMNAEAALMVGDYSYYGRGDFSTTSTFTLTYQPVRDTILTYAPWMLKHLGEVGDPSTAAKYYSMAADMKSPQAIFNLAFMYHWGIGVERDVHLAKRYYDTSAATHPHAAWPAQVGLMLLSLEFLTQPNSPVDAVNAAKENIDWSSIGFSWSNELTSFDTVVVIVLSTLLLFTLRLRNHHQDHNRALAEGLNPANA